MFRSLVYFLAGVGTGSVGFGVFFYDYIRKADTKLNTKIYEMNQTLLKYNSLILQQQKEYKIDADTKSNL
jgi:hypothetical protein